MYIWKPKKAYDKNEISKVHLFLQIYFKLKIVGYMTNIWSVNKFHNFSLMKMRTSIFLHVEAQSQRYTHKKSSKLL